MKRLFTLLLVLLFWTGVQAQNSLAPPARLSPTTKLYLEQWILANEKGTTPQGYIYKKLANGQLYVSSIIKVTDANAAQQGISGIGGYIGTKAGDIWTVQVPVAEVKDFTSLSGIMYIQLDEPVKPDLYVVRTTTHVDSVQQGINLPMAYSGKKVVVGVIDFGFDYNHPTFYDTSGKTYRIKRVWEQDGSGTPPSGYQYGRELADTDLIRAQGTDNSQEMHGTATTGIAAGSGFGSAPIHGHFMGMAYDADIVLVGVRREDIGNQWLQGGFSDFIDGVNYIFNYAKSIGEPAVVNISWGSETGSHDGTSLFNQACDNLSGAGYVVVMSAGNEGDENIHLSKTFSANDTIISTFLTFVPPVYKRTWVDVWGDTGKTFCARVTLYSKGVAGASTGFVCIDGQTHSQNLLGVNGKDTCYVEFITSAAEQNDKPRITVTVFNKAADSVGVSIEAHDGAINTWNEYYYYGFPYGYQSAFDNFGQSWAETGNTITTVSDMGSAKSVLLIGGYASKVAYTDLNNNSWTYAAYVGTGQLVPFSSRGPMIDGRIKPDITAPALTVATSVNSLDTAYTPTGSEKDLVEAKYLDSRTGKTYYFAEFSGTSASGPVASGITALLLQADPNLTPTELQQIIVESALKDNFTGAIASSGNNNWGHGKINAYKAMKLALVQAGTYYYSGEKLDCVLFPNPANGNFTLDLSTDKAEKINLRVYDLTGRAVLATEWNVSEGENRWLLDLSAHSTGTYIVSVTSSKGSVTIKAIKN